MAQEIRGDDCPSPAKPDDAAKDRLSPSFCCIIFLYTQHHAVLIHAKKQEDRAMKVKQQWFRKMNIGGSQKIHDFVLAADEAGSLYFVGQQQDKQIFLTKISCAGNELWRKQVYGPQDVGTLAISLAADSDGNTYLTGALLISAGNGQQRSRAWLAKFSSDGTQRWQRSLEGQYDWGIHLAPDTAGNLYLVGASGQPVQAGSSPASSFETWLAKISPSGDELWRRALGKQQLENYALGALGVDWAGNVCFLGATETVPVANGSSGQKNARAVKFSPDGVELWRQEIGTVMNEVGTGLGVDGEGNIYLAGFTDGEMVAGGAQGGGSDGWLIKLAPDGTELWRKQLGTDKHDTIDALTVDGLGNIYLAGFTNGEMVAGSAQGGKDAWAAKFSSAGIEQWRYQFGTAREELPASMAVLWNEGNNRGLAADGGGNIYLLGYVAGEWFEIKQSWLAKLYNVPENFEELDELNRLRFQTLQRQISRT